MALSIKDQIKQDIRDALTDVFEPSEFGWEFDEDKDILIAEQFDDEGGVVARYAVSITIDLDKLHG